VGSVDGATTAPDPGSTGTPSGPGGQPPRPNPPPDESAGPGRPGTPIDIEFIEAFGNPPSFFLGVLNDKCVSENLEPGCVTVVFDPNPEDEQGCRVVDNDPPVARTQVRVGSTLTFAVICDPDEGDPDEGDPDQSGSGESTDETSEASDPSTEPGS